MTKSLQDSKFKGEKLTYWRSIDNRRRTKEYISFIENEFTHDMTDITSMDRRSMLKVMGASIALSGIGISCRRPVEKILPYVKQPENIVPGIPNFFATAQPTPFGANGILVESHEGRPTKVEGNPSHPESRGKASLINQAAALEIYDPDRSKFCVREQAGLRLPADWVDWDSFADNHFFQIRKNAGEGLMLVSDSDLSPTFLRLKDEIKKQMPKAKFFVHEPMRQKNIEEATRIAFGQNTKIRYHLENAKVIATIFHDPFSFGPEHLRNMHGYGKNRQVLSPNDAGNMSRLYAVEADYSLAGTNADHRLRLPIGLAVNFVKALAYELHATHGIDIDTKILNARSLSNIVSRPPSYRGIDKKFVFVLAKDLAKNKGQSLIMGGNHLPPAVLALIYSLNIALLGMGRTMDVLSIDDKDAIVHLNEPDLNELAKELEKDRVSTLIFFGINPAYDAPRSLKFTSLIKKVKTSIHIGQTEDETGSLCSWHIPQTHFLEHFCDSRSFDGHISVIQPLIRPLHHARSNLQIMAQILGQDQKKPLDLLKETFRIKFGRLDADKKFNIAVHDGVIEKSAFKPIEHPRLNSLAIYSAFASIKSQAPNKENLELIIDFDRRVLDGRFANHSWLQELPDPVTKLNWGNALLISPALAKEYKIKSGVKKNAYVADIVEINKQDIKREFPTFVMPGLNDYSIIISLGYGRKKAGEVGNDVGVDAYDLIDDYAFLTHHGIKLQRTEKTAKLSSTQEQFAMNGDVIQKVDTLSLQNRDPARLTNLSDYVNNPLAAQKAGIPENLLVKEPYKEKKVPLQLTEAWNYSTGNQWGMVIDLAKCTGCNACVVACQSENNIPVVGKEQTITGRMMHWLRIDRYFVGDVKSPQAISQPIPCQHCENAPCEPVCPVNATTHDKEGLNVMTYNRCIGTRYCANNCPYKVRRFNYFDFSHSGNIHVDRKTVTRQKTIKLQRNPDVTVRYRGVMEKCTFCTQRIQEAKMAARRAGHDQNNLPDGSVTTACAQTCPSEAIVFGNINDENSRVSMLKKVDRNYTLLDVLNARPRTSYLSLVRNPHPDLVI
jgi:Fe-S-cluster-containing dehydrogenase component/anaerobic selenocysteine-containing dehydrogenase